MASGTPPVSAKPEHAALDVREPIDHEMPKTGDEALGSSVSRRCRTLTQMEWANIRQPFTYLYIDSNMTLRDTIQRIEEEYNFYASEQMYKKKIKAWGLSKHDKAEAKEQLIAKLLHNEPTTVGSEPIRHDKLIRYAKSRAKSGVLDSGSLSKIVKRKSHYGPKQPLLSSRFLRDTTPKDAFISSTTAAFVPRSPALPDRQASFDLFLRAMTSLIQKEKQEWSTGKLVSPDTIFNALSDGLKLWRRNEFTEARMSLSRAARNVAEDLEGPAVSVSRITYCVSSIIWGGKREPVFQDFARFMARIALENLGQICPLTIVLQQLQEEQSIDAQLAIWACAIDNNPLSVHNVDHWWGMAQRRWRWCQRYQLNYLAAQYCTNAMTQVRGINKLTCEMESAAGRDFEVSTPSASSSNAE